MIFMVTGNLAILVRIISSKPGKQSRKKNSIQYDYAERKNIKDCLPLH